MPVNPFLKADGERRLAEARQHVEAGDGLAVIVAMRICAEGHEIPDWLAIEFRRRTDLVLNGGANSWDRAFGKPWPGTQSRTVKHWRHDRSAVIMRVGELHAAGDAIDAGLFEKVGEELGLGASKVRDLYYDKENPLADAADLRKTSDISGNTRDQE